MSSKSFVDQHFGRNHSWFHKNNSIQRDFEALPKPWLDIFESAIIPSCADYKVDIGHFITQLD